LQKLSLSGDEFISANDFQREEVWMMRCMMMVSTLAALALAVAARSSHAQAYPRYPYDYRPGEAGAMGIGPGGREAYQPQYYSGVPYYGGPAGYGRGSNYGPNITGLPSYPMIGTTPGLLRNYQEYSSGYGPSPVQTDAAAIDVRVPAGARLWFDGAETQQRGPYRFFESPPLEPGKKYVYKVKAEWNDKDGKKVEREDTVHVHAGTYVTLDLGKPKS
jgi:uncharacterized protein (TIGR03000 family)